MASALETAIVVLKPDLAAVAVSRAVRSARGVVSQLLRPIAAELREVHDHQAYWARQYMPDSADADHAILSHANIWGVQQRGELVAVGSVLIEGDPTRSIPAGIEISASNGMLYMTTTGGVINAAGILVVDAKAQLGGAAGNLEAGVQLTPIVYQDGIRRLTVQDDFQGGADEQTLDELKAAYLERIRRPPHGGAGFDYPVWVKQVSNARAVGVVPQWIGAGSVGIIVVMHGVDNTARVPTEAEIETIEGHLGAYGSPSGVRPVTAKLVVLPARLVAINLSVRLRPDTAATRAAVAQAFSRFIYALGDDNDEVNASPIGAIIEVSRLSEAVSSAAGEYAHDLIVPTAQIALERDQFPVPGTITFVVH